MFKDLFQKKRKYATIPSERMVGDDQSQLTDRPKREIPEGLMSKCDKCGSIQYSKELEKNLKVCPSCGYHMRLNAMDRIKYTIAWPSLRGRRRSRSYTRRCRRRSRRRPPPSIREIRRPPATAAAPLLQ